MHKKFAAILLTVVLVAFLAVPCCAQTFKIKEEHFSMNLPDTFEEINAENADEHTDYLESIGYDETAFKNYLTENELALFAVDEAGTQIKLKIMETEFSKKVEGFSSLSDEDLEHLLNQMFTRKNATRTIVRGRLDYVQVCYNDKDSGGNFGVVQNLFLINGKMYSLSFMYAKTLTDDLIKQSEKTAETVAIKDLSANGFWGFNNIFELVFIIVALIGVLTAMVFLTLSIIREQQRKKRQEAENDIFIERRK